jgi:hypothetical protein
MPNPNTRLTAMQATSYLGISRSRLSKWMIGGHITGRRVFGTWDFTVSDLEGCRTKRALLWESMREALMIVIHSNM